jgi:hypothetical protein
MRFEAMGNSAAGVDSSGSAARKVQARGLLQRRMQRPMAVAHTPGAAAEKRRLFLRCDVC